MPTTVTAEEMRGYLAEGCKGAHESLLRAWNILNAAKDLLRQKTPPEVVLELIEHMEQHSKSEFIYNGPLTSSRMDR